MPKILICADDYGLTQSVNRGITACLKAGAVGSTCVMTNMAFFHEVKQLSRDLPNVSIGIHWNLTFGRPVSALSDVSTLIDEKGEFFNFHEFRKRLKNRKIKFNEVRVELAAQLKLLDNILDEVDFWNTHQNIHLWPGLFQFCAKLASASGIKKMRSNSRVTLTGNRFGYNLFHPQYAIKGLLLEVWTKNCRKNGFTTPDGLVAIPGAGSGKAKLEAYLERLQLPPSKRIVEATLHPADCSNDPLFGNLTASRFEEYKVFKDSALKIRLANLGYDCVSFRDL